MKLAAAAESLLERVALALGLVPTPFLDTHTAMILSRAVSAATRLGVIGALSQEALPVAEVARRCGTAPEATRALLDALAGAGYLRRRADRYALRRVARRWLRRESRWSLHDAMQWQATEWEWLGCLEEFMVRGEGLHMHERMTPAQWGDYQRGMRALARIVSPEIALRTTVPRGARAMLDVGGAHGLYSAALCRRHPGLRAVVLDLPDAVRHAAPLLAAEGMAERVVHRAGNVLEDDLGEEAWDVVLMAQLAHHFDASANAAIIRKVARALRPGGVFVVQDLLRKASRPASGGQVQGLYGLYFALISQGGTWSFDEVAAWQRAAGLEPRAPVALVTAPGMGLQVATKSAGVASADTPGPHHESR